MPTTKTATSIWSGVSNAAGVTTTSSVASITAGYGAVVNAKITNGGTGPTVAANITILTSADNANFYPFGSPLFGNTTSGGGGSWGGIELPVPVKYVKLQVTGNTGQAVTVDADVTEVTAV